MISIKNASAVARMKEAGQRLALILEEIGEYVVEGVSTAELDFQIEKKMRAASLDPVCIGYGSYRHASCISVNDVIVHGVPTKEVVLKNGDFVKIDVVGAYERYCADMARYFFVGDRKPMVVALAAAAQAALDHAIDAVKPGVFLSDISALIQEVVEGAGFNVVRDFCGHGIGRKMHEDPEVPNFGKRNSGGLILQEGMALAIEPMLTEMSYKVRIDADGWTARTADGGLAAHVEDTILVTRAGCEVLTRLTRKG
jgi:methionyl aminopeptidase